MQQTRTILVWLIVILVVIAAFLIAYQMFRYGGNRNANEREGESVLTANDTEARILRSEDGGVRWRGVPGTRSLSVTRMVFAGEGPALYVGTASMGLWKSTDAGLTFSQLTDAENIFDGKASVNDLAIRSTRERDGYLAVYYQNKGHVLEFINNKFTERYFTPVARVRVVGVASDVANAQRLFIATSDGGFLESLDAGMTWKLKHQFSGTNFLLVANPHISGMMWVVNGSDTIWRTEDYGATWVDARAQNKAPARLQFRSSFGANTSNIQGLFVHPTQNRLYQTSAQGLFVSDDFGTTWEAINLPLLPGSLAATALAIDPTHPAIMYVSADAQIYKSTDGGNSWKGIDFGGKRRIVSIVLDPKNTQHVIIGFE